MFINGRNTSGSNVTIWIFLKYSSLYNYTFIHIKLLKLRTLSVIWTLLTIIKTNNNLNLYLWYTIINMKTLHNNVSFFHVYINRTYIIKRAFFM